MIDLADSISEGVKIVQYDNVRRKSVPEYYCKKSADNISLQRFQSEHGRAISKCEHR